MSLPRKCFSAASDFSLNLQLFGTNCTRYEISNYETDTNVQFLGFIPCSVLVKFETTNLAFI